MLISVRYVDANRAADQLNIAGAAANFVALQNPLKRNLGQSVAPNQLLQRVLHCRARRAANAAGIERVWDEKLEEGAGIAWVRYGRCRVFLEIFAAQIPQALLLRGGRGWGICFVVSGKAQKWGQSKFS